MNWKDTVASHCRYGEIAETIWGDWDVLWEDSEDDYQGHASFIATKDGRYCWYEWWYGSCSGCDNWEAQDLSHEKIEQEMRDTAMWFDSRDQLKTWLTMMEGSLPVSGYRSGTVSYLDELGGGLRGRIDAIRKILGLPPLAKETE